MHGAPSVVYPVGRSAFLAVLLGVAWLAGALACLAWFATSASGWRAGLAIVACVAGAVVVARWWRTQAVGALAWDGAHWTWSADGGAGSPPGSLEVTLDLQRALLVRWSAPGCVRWFWLEREGAPARWDALRRAVYSPAVPDAQTGGDPPPA